MINQIPFYAFVVALFSVIIDRLGFPVVSIIPMGITFVLMVVGLIYGSREKPVSSRIACVMAFVLSLTPVLMPLIKAARLSYLEKIRDHETKPLFAKLDAEVEKVSPLIDVYYKKYSVMPDLTGRETMLQALDRSGNPARLPAMEGLSAPTDPFSKDSNPARWVAVRDAGVLMVSVGQDGTTEMPLPGVLMDRAPAQRLTGFAMLGVDPRLVTYDPTNGALSVGDVVRYHGNAPYEETFKPLFEAWNDANRVSPFKPTKLASPRSPDPDPQSLRDAAGAEKLLKEGKYMAALCLASRALNERPAQEPMWKDGDYTAERTRGLALYQLGAFREAADVLVGYTKLRSNEPFVHFITGASLYYGGNPDDAKRHVAAAAQISASDPVKDQAQACYEQLVRGGAPAFPQPEAAEKPEPRKP